MTAAYVLAGELAKAGGRHEDAFRAYEVLLRPYIAAKQRGAVRFASSFAPKTRWGLFLRNQVIKAFAYRRWRGSPSAGTSSTLSNCPTTPWLARFQLDGHVFPLVHRHVGTASFACPASRTKVG
jgi:hypothetical protein